MHKKRPKICSGCRVSTAKIYLYHSAKLTEARPHKIVSRSSGIIYLYHSCKIAKARPHSIGIS